MPRCQIHVVDSNVSVTWVPRDRDVAIIYMYMYVEM